MVNRYQDRSIKIAESFPNNLHQRPFPSSPVEFSIENLFPWAEIEFSIGNSNNDLSAHNLPFQVCISIILSNIMAVLGNRLVRGEFFEPDVIVVVKS